MSDQIQAVNSLSIIESINPNQVQTVMQKILQFQTIVQQNLKEEHDYGRIPGCGSKPTLLKPGAEKILMLMGVTSEYHLIEKVQDYEKGFFAYTVKCVLSRNGQTITEGLGHCNTKEKKYLSDKQDPYTLSNTCLKMAKKRAQIDATLTIASLSQIFTQDLEDLMDESETQKPLKRNVKQAEVVYHCKACGKEVSEKVFNYKNLGLCMECQKEVQNQAVSQ